jgi:hypothetical protein
MNGRSWVGKKGRTSKDNICTAVKHHPYAFSDIIPELNSITSEYYTVSLNFQPKEDRTTPADLLYELLHLQNNTGKLPQDFVQDLDD